MNHIVENFKERTNQFVVDCQVKDQSGLNDYQKNPDHEGIAIPRVGINRFRLPISIASTDGSKRLVDCQASMYVNLPAGKTGINMSRLCSILQEEALKQSINGNFFKNILNRYRHELRDADSDFPHQQAYLSLEFPYAVKQFSLKSNNWGWQYYQTKWSATQNNLGETKVYVSMNYEYSSTCPCSLSMAKQYEQDYAEGKIREGNGIGSAHSQRSLAKTTIQISPEQPFMLDDLISLMRIALPTETQSLVKRIDEQAFAILNGENPMFVEHACKRLYKVLNKDQRIIDWIVELQHFESLHSHNAVAVISKGIKNGLAQDNVF